MRPPSLGASKWSAWKCKFSSASLLISNNVGFYSKDVRLPVQLQRAMAAEAEAAREARAKVCFKRLFFIFLR